MKPLADGVLDGLRPFQQRSVERAWTSLTGKEGSRRFLVADEVGLGKTRVASAVIRQFAASGRRKGRGQVVIYFAPNAEVSRQNLRVLRTDAPANEPRARLTLLPLMAEQLERPGMHVLAFTPQTSLRVGRGTGTAEERALLLRLLRPVWRCGDGDDVVHVFRDRAQLRNFRGAINQVADVQTSSKLALAFQEAVEKHPDYKREFRRLRAEVGDGGLPKAEQRARRKLLGELRRLLAGSCLIGLSPKLVIFDEFQRYPDVLRGADVPGTLEHALLRQVPALLLSATPYKMTAAEQDPGAGVELTRLLRFLLADEAAAARAGTQLGELRRSFIRLRLPTQSGHVDSVHRARAAAAQVEATLSPVMSRWQRPDDGAGSTPAERLLPAAEDVRAHLAFQRAVDGVADVVGLRHRATVEYWKSAPYLANFMRGYRVKQAIDEAWKHDERRRQVQRALARGPHSVLPMRDVERYRPVPTPNARYRVLSQMSLEHGQWQALWVPPALSPYAPEGRFATVAARGATKTLVFSGWRVVPSAVAALLGYEAEQRAGSEARARNTLHARKQRSSAQLLSLRYDRTKGVQRATVLALVYPSAALADVDVYSRARTLGHRPSAREVTQDARRLLAPGIAGLRDRQTGPRVDPNWYWAAPMLLDQDALVDVARLARSGAGFRGVWETREDATQGQAVRRALTLVSEVVSGTRPLGQQPDDLEDVVARLAVAAPGVVALRALRRLGTDDEVRLASARIGWGLRTLLNRADATLVVRTRARRAATGEQAAYWRDALDYCVEGALQGVVDEYVHLLSDEHRRPDAAPERLADDVAAAFAAATDLQPLAVEADIVPLRGGPGTGEGLARRRLGSRFAVAFGGARTEDDAGVHPEIVRQAFNSPFWPWTLITTSVGQEGLDFHRYCHQLVHWNVPASPVELEQREGRIIRFFNHAVRKNIAEHHGAAGWAAADPWTAMVEAARDATGDVDGFSPEWVLQGPHKIKKVAPVLAYSRDHERFERVRKARVFYRLVLGQPNPEELVEAMMETMTLDDARVFLDDFDLALDLRPKL